LQPKIAYIIIIRYKKTMNITFENADKVNGLLTITIEQADYQEAVEKTLKNYRKRAQVPGFRPGMVPMGMIKKQYGTAVKMDEINRLLGDKLMAYIRENNIQMLGEPLASESQEPQDLEKDGPFTFKFDIAVAPEFKAELTGKDKIDYYTIKVDDKLIDDQVQMYAQQAGEFQKADVFSGNDTLTGDLRQLDADGNTLEGGITTDSGMVMPAYIKDEAQRKLFDGCKPGDIITFNPKKAYPDNDAEVAALLKVKKEDVKDLESDFSYQVTEIRHFQPAEVNQQLFDRVFGEGTVTDEKAFRQKISEQLETQLVQNSDYKFLTDLRVYMEKKVGKLEFPEALLKKVMLNNNKDKGADFVEKNFEGSIKELAWHLIKEQLVAAQEIKVEDADLKAIAKEAMRAQFAQYGMSNIPDDVLENYAEEQLKKRENLDNFVDRAVDQKLVEKYKTVVKLNEKSVTLEEFNKMMRGE
jgi:trigger factor